MSFGGFSVLRQLSDSDMFRSGSFQSLGSNRDTMAWSQAREYFSALNEAAAYGRKELCDYFLKARGSLLLVQEFLHVI